MKIYYNGEKSTLGCQCCKPKLGIHHQLPVPMSASTQMVDGPRSIHVPLPPSLQQSRSPQSWKRKGKCQSCRQARKKCQPEIRIWPKKCLRCVERGLSCSIPFLANGTVAAERGYASEQAEIAWNFLTIDQRGLENTAWSDPCPVVAAQWSVDTNGVGALFTDIKEGDESYISEISPSRHGVKRHATEDLMNLVRHSRQRQQLNSKHLLSVLGSSPEVCVGSSATIEEPSSTILHMADGPSTTAEMVAKGTQPPSVAFAGTSKLLVQPYYGPERTNPGANIETATQYQPERYFNIGNSIPFASLGEPPSYHEYLRQTEEGFCNPPLAPSLTSSKSSFQRFKRSSVLSRTMDDNEVLQPPSTARRFSESSNLSIISSLSQQFSAMSVSFNASKPQFTSHEVDMEARDEERNGSYNEVHLEPEPFKHEPIIQDLNARYQIYIAARQDTGLDE